MTQESTPSLPAPSSPPTSQLCSLSRMDSVFGPVVYTTCLMVDCPGDNFDELIYQAAVEKAIDKNRIFAGRVQKEKINDLPQLLVPLGELPKDYKLCNFSCQTIDKFINYPQLNSSAHELITMPELNYFRVADTPSTISEFIEKDLPIFAFLVTKTRNIVCIGITFTHVVVDGGALELLVKSINEELDNVSGNSKPIPLHKENLLEQRYEELLKIEGVRDIGPLPYNTVYSTKTVLKWAANFLWEYVWHTSRVRVMYVGQDLLADVVSKAKVEAALTGTFVSTNDILMAWLIKTTYSAEKWNSNSLSIVAITTPRSILGLETYPHNVISHITLSEPSIAELASDSIAKTALDFRKAILDSRKPEIFAKEFVRYSSGLGIDILATIIGVDHWGFNNQTVPSIFTTNWTSCLKEEPKMGSRPVRIISCVAEKDLFQNCFSIIEMNKEGFLIKANIRKARWQSITREVDELAAIHHAR